MRTLLFITGILICFAGNAQNQAGGKKSGAGGGVEKKINLSGTWQGILTQPNGGLDDNYAFWISFKQTKDSLKGLSRLEVNNTNNFGILELKGAVNGNELTIKETKITDENIKRGASWCIKKYTLVYNEADGSLSGEWIAPNKCGPGKIYLYRTENAFSTEQQLSPIYLSYDDFKLNLKEGKKVSGNKIIIPDMNFEQGKWDLNDVAKKRLDDFAGLLKMHSKLTVKILGHTDNAGDDFPNLTLSLNRAKAIVNYLKSKGINAKRLQYEAFGEARPVRENTNENGRIKNRRMEFEVVKE